MSALAEEVLAFCERTGTAHSTFGRAVSGDWRLVRNLVEGRKVGSRIADLIASVMAAHPGGFPRPKAERKSKKVHTESQVSIDVAKARVASERLRKATLFVRPENAAPRAPLTFEEKLARVASGRATISPAFPRHHLTPTVRAA